MSEHRVKTTVEVWGVEAYTCDACKKVVGHDSQNGGDDWIERQEMLHWRNFGGYGSVFGDGARMSLDLCQSCIKERLGDIIQFEEESENEP